MAETIGFIGLGRMGVVMAGNLLEAGFPLRVYNRTSEKARPLVERGAVQVPTPKDAAQAGGVVLTMLADDRALDVVMADDVLAALGGDGVHVSMSTVLPATHERLAERHAAHGVALVAAPVFGRPDAAAARKLWIATSGPADAKRRVRPVLEALGQGVFDFGETPAAANVVKLAGNFLLASAVEAMAEASAFAEKSGVPRARLFEMLTQTLFPGPVYGGYSRVIVQSDFRDVKFAMPLVLKDLTLVQQTASAGYVPMPMLDLVRGRVLSMLATGRGHLDASALALPAAESAGLNWLAEE